MTHPKMTAHKSMNIGKGREEPIPEPNVFVVSGDGKEPCFLAFPATLVGAGESVVVTSMPQTIFRSRRLVVAPECAPFFTVHDIKLGSSSILLNSYGAPASCFPPLPRDKEDLAFLKELETMLHLHIRTAQISQIISILVHNDSDKPQVFKGMLWGETLSDEGFKKILAHAEGAESSLLTR